MPDQNDDGLHDQDSEELGQHANVFRMARAPGKSNASTAVRLEVAALLVFGKSTPQNELLEHLGTSSVTLELCEQSGVDEEFQSTEVTASFAAPDLILTETSSQCWEVNSEEPDESTMTTDDSCNQQIIERLKSVMASDRLVRKTMLVVMKAMHFKCQWEKKIHLNVSKDRPFYVERNATRYVPTICIKRELRVEILSDRRATLIEIPYQSEKISMIIIVPKRIDELGEVHENFGEEILNRGLQQGCFTETRLLLPKIDIKSTSNVEEALGEFGMTNILENNLDFRGIIETLIKDNVDLHQAFTEVGKEEEEEEERTESATVTRWRAAISRCGLPCPVYRVNRPFYYQVVSSILKVPLFGGFYTAHN